jgi:hypothetical protein
VIEPAQPWALERFQEVLDAWAERDKPSVDLRFVVTEWVLSLFDDPYKSARRENAPNLWSVVVPGSAEDPYQVVFCSYWIEERRHVVRCDNIATLSYPV